jgi:hypothetical protein
MLQGLTASSTVTVHSPLKHCTERMLITVCTRSIISLEDSYICACSILDNPLKLHENVSSNKFYSRQRERKHVEGTCRLQKKWTEFVLHWRHLQDIHSRWVCLHHQHRLQQKCRICVHIRRLWFTNATSQIMKQDWILLTGTFVLCMLDK